jgi:general secretion pathway protein F
MEASDRVQAIAGLRRMGASPLEVVPAASAPASRDTRLNAKGRATATTIIGELAVLLQAGLQLERALALAIENVEDAGAAAHFVDVLRSVREGVPLSRAMAQKPGLFSPTAVAMTEAGEANGRLGEALARLSAMLEQSAELRRLVGTSMIYPIALLVIAVGVILLMLLFVIPQFESLFATSQKALPAASMAVMAASRFVRTYGLWLLGGGVIAAFGLRSLLAHPAARGMLDGWVLRVPQLGELVRRIETARFARTLGALIEGEVPLPAALTLSQRTISNGVIAAAVEKVATGVKEGGGVTAPLAAARVLPRLAIGFFRTGEETSQLGLMLTRLADVLDRDVKVRLQRLIGILTPLITVVLGATVAAIIASIMSAILGFNDLAVGQ